MNNDEEEEASSSEAYQYMEEQINTLSLSTAEEDYEYWEHLDENSIIIELNPEQVRWFYKIESDKRWIEFTSYDSYRIEVEYRHYSVEWHNYEGSQHGAENIYQFSKHQIVVRDGLYEVDINTWKCYSIFWPGEEFQIQRGIWFYEGTWQPVEYPHSEMIENVHLQLFCGHRISDYMETPRRVLHTEKLLTEFHVDWHSPSCVFLYSEAAPSKLVRSVTQRLGFQKRYRILRGYKTLANENDQEKPKDITHLVFVIHGIGQKMDTGRIIRNSNSFRDCVSWLQNKYFNSATCDHRAEFFPVEWRSSLKLDGDIVQDITPLYLEKLRQLLNASAMDIMYYTSPLFGKEIQAGLCNELNRLFSMFIERNPDFESKGGKVSVIAHSLGCVIVYDIVTGWIPPNQSVHQSSFRSEESSNSQITSGLLFQIEHFFCLGSPLSVFLALRWKDPQDRKNHAKILPANLCKRLYNIFHPTDAVAYRMEPLLVKEYKDIAPLVLHQYNSSSRKFSYEMLPLEPIQPETNVKKNDLNDSEIGENPTSPPTPLRDRWSLWNLMKVNTQAMRNPRSCSADSPATSATTNVSPIQEQETSLRGLEYRMDYILKEKQLSSSYFAAITSHIAYWDNYDVGLFILTKLFPDLEETQASSSLADTNDRPPSPADFCA